VNQSVNNYDVTVTVARDGGRLPDLAGFAAAVKEAAASRGANVMSAHTYEQIINVVTAQAPSRSDAVAAAQAVVSEALGRSAVSAA
jgi:hypothetical protein